MERAVRLISDGALDDAGVEVLAERLGIGPRHLSRLFRKHLGASPVQVARTGRVQRGKRLLETDLSITEIAPRSGFSQSATLQHCSCRSLQAAADRDSTGTVPQVMTKRPVGCWLEGDMLAGRVDVRYPGGEADFWARQQGPRYHQVQAAQELKDISGQAAIENAPARNRPAGLAAAREGLRCLQITCRAVHIHT